MQHFELSAAGVAELNSQVQRKCGMALYGRILVAFVPDILFSGLSNIKGKGNVAHVQTTFHVRIMVLICFVLVFASARIFLFMKMLDFSEND